jgi:hypothetical protein
MILRKWCRESDRDRETERQRGTLGRELGYSSKQDKNLKVYQYSTTVYTS